MQIIFKNHIRSVCIYLILRAVFSLFDIVLLPKREERDVKVKENILYGKDSVTECIRSAKFRTMIQHSKVRNVLVNRLLLTANLSISILRLQICFTWTWDTTMMTSYITPFCGKKERKWLGRNGPAKPDVRPKRILAYGKEDWRKAMSRTNPIIMAQWFQINLKHCRQAQDLLVQSLFKLARSDI